MLVGLVKVELVDFNFDFQFDKPVIGVDEVGRGSWAGPVMAGAAFLNHKLPIDKRLQFESLINFQAFLAFGFLKVLPQVLIWLG